MHLPDPKELVLVCWLPIEQESLVLALEEFVGEAAVQERRLGPLV